MLYAQPIVDLRTGAVVQQELLLRLREPDGKIVGPAEYLDVAERYGLIGDIDRWVIEQGAQLAATGTPVEVNVSGRSIGDPAILAHIERCIGESGADPASIVFEVTETALVEDHAATRQTLTRILTRRGHQVLEACGVAEAIALQVIVLDLDHALWS